MGTHPTFSPSTGPAVAYQPKTYDQSDGTVAGTVVPAVQVETGFVTTDKSGTTSATVGTFTTPIAVNSARRFLRITNINTSGVLYIYDKTGGTPTVGMNCYALNPGGSTTYDAKVPTDAIQIAGSVASLKFEAAEGN